MTTAMTPDALTPAMERLCAAAFGPECEVRWWGSGTGAAVTVHIAALVPGMTADTAGVSWCLDGAWTIHDPAELEVVGGRVGLDIWHAIGEAIEWVFGLP